MIDGLSDLKQKDWIRACKKLDLIVDCSKGKGSHCLIKHPLRNKSYTIQKNLYKIANQKIFKKLQEWGFTEKDIKKAIF